MRQLMLLTVVCSTALAQQREVPAGPIWNQADAQVKCPNVCRPPEKWSGVWRTTVQGRASVCTCVVEAPPPMDLSGKYEARGRDRGESLTLGRDGRFTRANGETGTWTWDGRTLTLRDDPVTFQMQPDGTFFDAQRNVRLRREMPPPPPVNRNPPELVGQYRGTHPQWQDMVTLGADGRFARGNGDPGSWWFERNTLFLKWDRWGMASLQAQPDGSFFDPQQSFRLARAVVVPPPPPRPAQEFRSRLMRLDRGFYRAGEQPIVYWEGMPANNAAWISIVPRGAADGEWGDWTYTRGATSGSFAVPKPLPAGEYEVRAYGAAMSPVIDRLPFRVGR